MSAAEFLRDPPELAPDPRPIKAVFVYPPTGSHTPMYWMAYFEGDEHGGARGWGTTRRESEKALLDQPLIDPRHVGK